MWPKKYKDYGVDEPLKKETVESGKGLVGCEMHDLNGWGELYHKKQRPKRGIIQRFLQKVKK